jgi:hypothetical protein
MNTGGPHHLRISRRSSEVKSVHLESRYPGPPGKFTQMPAKAIQHEIDQLKGVSTRLDSLADQHPIMEDEIISIAGNVLSNAVLLEVLLATRTDPA